MFDKIEPETCLDKLKRAIGDKDLKSCLAILDDLSLSLSLSDSKDLLLRAGFRLGCSNSKKLFFAYVQKQLCVAVKTGCLPLSNKG